MLYLCSLFAPGKEFFRNNVDFYAGRSEWVEASTPTRAVSIYKARHGKLTRGDAGGYVKILFQQDGGHRDGEVGYDKAMEIMVSYYVKNQGSPTG